MKSIQTLIKLQQRQLDEKRRVLKHLQEKEELLRAKKEELKCSIIEERKKASGDLQASVTLPAFIKMTQQNIEIVGEQITLTQAQAETVRNEIAEIFGELKRYEIYDEIKEAEATLKESQREQKEMDEMGLRGFIYKDKITD